MPSSTNSSDVLKTITIEEVAETEKELLPKYEELHLKVTSIVNEFNQGTITREILNQKLNSLKPQFEQIKEISLDFYTKYQLNENDSQKAQYLDDLVKGNSITSILSNMITIPVEGETVIIDNKTDNSDDPLKETFYLDDNQLKSFFSAQEEAYQQDVAKLKKVLAQIQ